MSYVYIYNNSALINLLLANHSQIKLYANFWHTCESNFHHKKSCENVMLHNVHTNYKINNHLKLSTVFPLSFKVLIVKHNKFNRFMYRIYLLLPVKSDNT